MVNEPANNAEMEATLGLLRAIENNHESTQRSMAQELGIAVGLVNAYIKRCVKKGLVKVAHAPNNRYAYYLTPQGFIEKSRLTVEFLSQSLNLFRQAQNDYTRLLDFCAKNGWTTLALCGAGDLAEIFVLYAREYPVRIVGVIETADAAPGDTYCNVPVVAAPESMVGRVDAVVISDLRRPQEMYDRMVGLFPPERVLAPRLLELRTVAAREGAAP